jgi:hypothetical protein
MRTIAEIYAEIVAYKDSQTFSAGLLPVADTEANLLDDLNTGSKVAIWRLWAYVIAAAIYAHEALYEIFRAEVDDKANAANAGTARWYRDKVLEFQLGDELEYDAATGKYRYPSIQTDRLVKQCAVVEGNNGIVLFKVARIDNGQLKGLTNDQKNALESYLKKVRFAGTRFAVTTGDGDLIFLEIGVFYDATRTLTVVKASVEERMKDYVEKLPFNGEFYLSELIDAIQMATGVNDVELYTAETRAINTSPWTEIERVHVPVYGYYNLLSPDSELDIQYIPQ